MGMSYHPPHEESLLNERTSLGVTNRGIKVNSMKRHATTCLIIASNIAQMIFNFSAVAGGVELAKILGADSIQAGWIAASYGLTQGALVLITGPIGSVYGHKKMLVFGGLWLSACSLAGGLCDNFEAFVAMRALSGIGGACIMPNAVALIAITNPPGRTRNMSLGFFGASSPIGGYLGSLLLGLFIEYTEYRWFYVAVSLTAAAISLTLWFIIPPEKPINQHGTIDWAGGSLGVAALIMFNIAWNQAPVVGWSQPYVIVILIISLLLLAGFVVYEQWFTNEPIMPLKNFKTRSFGSMVLVMLLNSMAVGIFNWYQVLWIQGIWKWSVLHFALGWTPFAIFAVIGAGLAAWMIPRFDAQWILALGTLTMLGANLLMATLPVHQTYWAQVFPSDILFAFSPDLVYTAGQIVASNSVEPKDQGAAGSLVSVIFLYGNSLGIGFASTVELEVMKLRNDQILSYRAAFYFALGISAVAFILNILFVKVVKRVD